jgi:DNA-binding transcriptional regulator YdaS (Cro superfamily)
MSPNTDNRVLRLLQTACEKAGSQNKWAKQHGITQQYVNQVLNGHRTPGPQILAALGLTRVTRVTKASR